MAFIALGILVVMGIMAGGMVALALIGPRRLQNTFGVGAACGLLGGLSAAVAGGLGDPQPWLPRVQTDILNFVLSGFIGYAVTTYFVLSYRHRPAIDPPDPGASAGPGKMAVIYFAPGEAEQYDVRVAARGFETADDPERLPPALLRPWALLRLKRQYAAVGQSPYRGLHLKLAQKVQDRLGKRYKVYIAFYNANPALQEVAAEALREGARQIVVLHARLTSPPPAVNVAEWLEPLRLTRYGATLVETGPLYNSDLLPSLFVRRALAAMGDGDRAAAGVLLVGPGHPESRRSLPGPAGQAAPLQRRHQESMFQQRVRQGLIKAGFADDHVVLAWLAWQPPDLAAAYAALRAAGCAPILLIASGLPADGLSTLYDMPRALAAARAGGAVAPTVLGPWNDDDVAAEALVERVKRVTRVEEAVGGRAG